MHTSCVFDVEMKLGLVSLTLLIKKLEYMQLVREKHGNERISIFYSCTITVKFVDQNYYYYAGGIFTKG